MEKVKIVLLTGGSSGIGAATAKLLAEAGMKVYAGSRRGTTEKPAPGVVPIRMDVNDEASVQAAVQDIISREGRLDALVCNAGNGIYSPVEGTSDEEARYQFETTYFGALRSIQACLPQMRAQGFGRIITVTSVMAILPLPFQGFYASTKAALLSISESLSMELHGSGIHCCSILPGDVKTGFTAARRQGEMAPPYRKWAEKNLRKIEKDEQGGMEPEVIGRAILRQLKRRKMRVRYIPRIDYGLVGILVRIVPESLKLWIIRHLY